MEKAKARLEACAQAGNDALDLSDLTIDASSAHEIGANLPKWWVGAIHCADEF